jgi:type IV secretory pathway component VirB8
VLGMTFWKRAASEEQAETSPATRAFDPLRARNKILSMLVLAGAALAIIAIVTGMPVIGLVIYLISILPYVLIRA